MQWRGELWDHVRLEWSHPFRPGHQPVQRPDPMRLSAPSALLFERSLRCGRSFQVQWPVGKHLEASVSATGQAPRQFCSS